jgi:ppGpp synthetase/RelA/SpoT-type nucleotidyltranferase
MNKSNILIAKVDKAVNKFEEADTRMEAIRKRIAEIRQKFNLQAEKKGKEKR